MTSIKRVGIVEIGSRAVRLLVADVSPDTGLRVVSSGWQETQLAATVKLGRSALRAKINEVDTVVRAFLKRCGDLRASHIGVFGTEALRQMSRENRPELSKLTPYVIILDKKSEALCSLIAAVKGLPAVVSHGKDVLAIDQGAGSMELAIGKLSGDSVDLVSYKSYSLGTETLIRLFRKNNGSISRLRDKLEQRIIQYKLVGGDTVSRAIVLGSAATKFAWIRERRDITERYDPRRVHGQIITVSSVDDLVKVSIDNPVRIRRIIDPRNPHGDEFEIVVAGLVALSIFLRKLGKTEFVVSGWGSRYGMAWVLACNDPRVRWTKDQVRSLETYRFSDPKIK